MNRYINTSLKPKHIKCNGRSNERSCCNHTNSDVSITPVLMITLNPSRRKEGLKDTKPYPYALFREALEPQKSVPRAVLGTVFIATLLPALDPWLWSARALRG